MSARSTIELALTRLFRRETNPHAAVTRAIADYTAACRIDAFNEAIQALHPWGITMGASHAPGVNFAVGVLTSVRDDRTTDCTADATFFQPGRRYSHGDWQFHCATVTGHPATGKKKAIGWITFNGIDWQIHQYSTAEWGTDWTDITPGGAAHV